MAINNGYISLEELKDQLGKTSPSDDLALEVIIEGVSRWVDDHTQRRFYAVSETRYYTPEFPYILPVYDIVNNSSTGAAITSIKSDDNSDGVFETTWAASDYFTRPYNPETLRTVAGVRHLSPVTAIEVNMNGLRNFPRSQRSLEVVADFGYSSVAPSQVRSAALIASARLWKRRDAIFGVAGTASLGVQTVIAKVKADDDIVSLLQGFVPWYGD